MRSFGGVVVVHKQDRVLTDGDAYEWALQTTGEFERRMERAFETYQETLSAALSTLPQDYPDAALNALPWSQAEAQLVQDWTSSVRRVVLAAGKRAGDQLITPSSFIVDNPYTERWLRDHGAEEITGVSTQTKMAVRDEIRRGVQEHRPVRETARVLRDMVGLNAPQGAAWSRDRAALVAEGLSQSDVERKSQAYARKLLRQRGEMIARTETIDAMNHGQMASWQSARDKGMVPSFARRKWIAGGADRTCPMCLDFAGQLTTLDGPFTSKSGAFTRMAPTAHPGCRCTTGLTYDRGSLYRMAA